VRQGDCWVARHQSARLSGHTGAVTGVAFPANGQSITSSSFDGTLRVWDVQSGKSVRSMRAERCYERLDITGLTGITEGQRQALLALGAKDGTL
jgi:WD40 repeat protein